jgi:hypothetical protein
MILKTSRKSISGVTGLTDGRVLAHCPSFGRLIAFSFSLIFWFWFTDDRDGDLVHLAFSFDDICLI